MYILKPLSKLIIFYYMLYKTMDEVKVNRNMNFLIFIWLCAFSHSMP